MTKQVILKSDDEIDAMRCAGELAYRLLEEVESILVPGTATTEIDAFVAGMTRRYGGVSAPLGYHGFPASVCVSIGSVVCHGIPSSEVFLRSGDIVNVDVTPRVGGFHGDSSRTYLVGEGHPAATCDLVDAARRALFLGIEAVRPGAHLGCIGAVIEEFARKRGYGVVTEYVGHGIGREFHEEPMVRHTGKRGRGRRLEPGMTFTIEPMLNAGGAATRLLKDGWTVVTRDGSLSAQFEHTVAIRSDWQVEILTLPRDHPDQKSFCYLP